MPPLPTAASAGSATAPPGTGRSSRGSAARPRRRRGDGGLRARPRARRPRRRPARGRGRHPRLVKDFAQAYAQRSKTDRAEARTLLAFAERVPSSRGRHRSRSSSSSGHSRAGSRTSSRGRGERSRRGRRTGSGRSGRRRTGPDKHTVDACYPSPACSPNGGAVTTTGRRGTREADR